MIDESDEMAEVSFDDDEDSEEIIIKTKKNNKHWINTSKCVQSFNLTKIWQTFN